MEAGVIDILTAITKWGLTKWHLVLLFEFFSLRSMA